MVDGAAYIPAAETVPTVALPPVAPLTFHVTAPVAPLLTVAVNCWRPVPALTLASDGEIETETEATPVMCTAADAVRVGSVIEAAVTVTVDGDGTDAGAL